MTVYADVFRYRDLFANLFRRGLSAKYKGSLLGVAWSLVHPVVLMGVYALVFSLLLRAVDIAHYPLFLLTGLAAWIFFSSSLQSASRSLLEHADLITKTRFPRQLVPLAFVATQVVAFSVMVVALGVVNFVVLPDTRDTVWLAIPLAVLFVLFVAGLAVAVACLNVLFRDVEHLLTALLLPWFFVTPVLYTFDALPDAVKRHPTLVHGLRWANPVTPAIQAFRDPLFFGRLPRAADVVYFAVATVAALAVGALVFTRVDDRLAVEL